MFYFVRTPGWLKKLYRNYTWDVKNTGNSIYLTFDDGPHPSITGFVLDELKKYKAHATFFCIGNNIFQYPEVYQRIIDEGHATGNHTYDHLNGWKTEDEIYFENVQQAGKLIHSQLFRPPFGRIKRSQFRKLKASENDFKVIMWDVLSADFDTNISREKCLANVLNNARCGSIIVFHDSEKAREKMCYALPEVLKFFTEKGYLFKKIEIS
ncbi:MAG: polysaccharide deacetylase family protein [Ferruginibacter sp.]